jgi:hypothetical protein
MGLVPGLATDMAYIHQDEVLSADSYMRFHHFYKTTCYPTVRKGEQTSVIE